MAVVTRRRGVRVLMVVAAGFRSCSRAGRRC
jgi:hypothetical protein